MGVNRRGVLVDLDGTLLDHEAAAAVAVTEWASTLAEWPAGPDEARRRWKALERRFFPVFLRGECSFAEQRRWRVRAFMPSLAALTDDEADEMFARYLTFYEANWRARPEAEFFIERVLAAGLPLGVLTNGDESQQIQKLQRTGLARPRLQLFASSALGCAKPSQRAFTMACAELGTLPSQTVMIGDDLVSDVHGAREAGLRALHLDPCGQGRDPDRVASLSEAAAIVVAE